MSNMTVDALIAALQEVSADGFGHAEVIVEAEGDGYFGGLLRVDTLMTSAPASLTLVTEAEAVSA